METQIPTRGNWLNVILQAVVKGNKDILFVLIWQDLNAVLLSVKKARYRTKCLAFLKNRKTRPFSFYLCMLKKTWGRYIRNVSIETCPYRGINEIGRK